VHIPLQAPAELIEKYKAKAKRLGLEEKPLEKGEPYPTTKKQGRFVMRRTLQSDPVYAAMIENVDTNVGRLVGAIEKARLNDNTIVILTSDNGGVSTSEGSPTCNLPLRDGKGWLHEGGIREPLIVVWPGKTLAGSVCDTPVTSPDFLPTLTGRATEDGIDITPLLEGTTIAARDLFWHYPHYGNQGGTPGGAIRSGDWKLIEFYEDGRLELFNLKDDIGETKDLSKENPQKTRELHEKLIAWRSSVNAKMPTKNPDWKQ
jgi:arylsulfatase A-like enzyme